MLKAYKYRIYPTEEQEQLFLQANGLCRLYWNTTLARKQEAYEKGEKWNIGSAKAVFSECKPEALEWIKAIDSTILAAEWSNVINAFNNFFNSCSKKEKESLSILQSSNQEKQLKYRSLSLLRTHLPLEKENSF